MIDELDLVSCKCGHPASWHEPDMDGVASGECQEYRCPCESFDFGSEEHG